MGCRIHPGAAPSRCGQAAELCRLPRPFDVHIQAANLAYVMSGHELFGIAHAAGLTGPLDQVVVQWVGQARRRWPHRARSAWRWRSPALPPGRMWTQHELSRVSDHGVTYTGRTEADRVQRQRRAVVTDEVMGLASPRLRGLELPEAQRRAIKLPLVGLRAALDGERYEAAVCAAKELVEAATKLVLARAGVEPTARASVASLAKLALATRRSARRLAGADVSSPGFFGAAAPFGDGECEDRGCDCADGCQRGWRGQPSRRLAQIPDSAGSGVAGECVVSTTSLLRRPL